MNPIIRAALSGAFGSRDLSFFAPLRTSLVPARGTGSATYTRATIATVTDHEGVLRTVKSGEARFQGARRVENLLTYSEDLTNGVWSKAGVTITGGQLAPDGSMTAFKVVEDTSNGVHNLARTGILAAPNWGAGSIYLKPLGVGAARKFGLGLNNSLGPYAPAGSDWYRHSYAFVTGGAAGCYFGLADGSGNTSYQGDGVSGFLVWHPQFENVTGQSVQTAGEYVSNGMLSSPWHGAGVDGVRYFDTTLAGVPIPAATLLGYQPEGARTNNLLWGRDFTRSPWVKTTMTAAITATGIDGLANSASTLTATSANATALQTIVFAAAARSFGLYVKRRTGTGTVEITRDGLSWTDITSQINASTYTRVRIENTSVLNPILGVRLVTSGDAIDVDGGQDEAGAFLSSPMLSGTAAASRSADVLTYPSAGNISGTQGTIFVEVTRSDLSRFVFVAQASSGSGDNQISLTVDASNRVLPLVVVAAADQGTAPTTNTVAINTQIKAAITYKTNGTSVCLNGGTVATDATNALPVVDRISIGSDNGVAAFLFGTTRNVRLYNRAFSEVELMALTS